MPDVQKRGSWADRRFAVKQRGMNLVSKIAHAGVCAQGASSGIRVAINFRSRRLVCHRTSNGRYLLKLIGLVVIDRAFEGVLLQRIELTESRRCPATM